MIRRKRYLSVLTIALFTCTHTPDNCGDGGDTLDKSRQFCRDGTAWTKCGGKDYDPYSQFCSAEKTYEKCNGKDEYDPLREFCSAGKVIAKCGGAGDGGATYDPETQGCYSGIVKSRCGNNFFDPNNEFCFNIRVYDKCNGNEFDPTIQSCAGEAVLPKCGTGNYNPETHFCDNNVTYAKCGGNDFNPTTSFCSGGAVYAKCGGREYDPSRQTCNNGTTVTDIVGPPKCNGVEYDGETNFCYNNTNIIPKCGGQTYDPLTQECNGSTVIVIPPDIQRPKYTVYFNTNGGTDGANPPKAIEADSGRNIILPGQQTMGYAGYSFGGWNTSNLGAGTAYKEGDLYTVTATTNLYARWIPIHTVTFDANNATGGAPREPVRADSGTAITLPGKGTLTRTGYSFGGWNTAAVGGINYKADSSYIVTGNATLYASWIPVYTVTYNGNGATVGVPEAVNADSGTNITLPGQGSMARTNYHFGGWGTTSSGGTNYPANSSYLVMGNVTLYARWTNYPIYTVTYNGNGNTGGSVPAVSLVDSGSTTPITLPGHGTLVKTGYNFGGWNKNSSGTGTNYNVGSSYTVTKNDTLYAKWTIKTYTVTFDGNGTTAGVPQAVNNVDSGSTITLPGQGTMARIGYTFGGWNTNESGTGTNYNGGSSYTVNGSVTLYAKWTAVNYTITYTLNGGTVSTANPTSYNIETASFWLYDPTRTGYEFAGWTGSNGTTAETWVTIAKGSTGNREYTANWTVINYTLTTNVSPSGGGSVSRSPNETIYPYGTSVTVTAIPTSGYTFMGWSGALTGTTNSATVTMNGNKELTANFYLSDKFFMDVRDNKLYKKVTIGTQTWMAENLNYTTSSGSWCHGANPNCTYGRLYDWSTAMNISTYYNSSTWGGSDVMRQGVCPNGWHLPSRVEWNTLVDYVGGYSTAGTKLKSSSAWKAYSGVPAGADIYGFSALPGGGRAYDGSFYYFGSYGGWWTATENGVSDAYGREMYYDDEGVDEYTDFKSLGYSVRCLGD
jgi:uncharacterized protein (TIGR02145 family)/uncharacterized repeat protein (TIGR02543 family)